MEPIFYPVISIPILYFFFTFTKSFWVKLLWNIDACTFCLSVGATWLWMLIARSLGINEFMSYKADLVLAIMFGMTSIGLLWKLEDYYKGHEFKRWYIIKLFYTVSTIIIAYGVALNDTSFDYELLAGILLFLFSMFLFFYFSKLKPSSFWGEITRKEKSLSVEAIPDGRQALAKTDREVEGREVASREVERTKKERPDKTEDEKALEKMDKMFEDCC